MEEKINRAGDFIVSELGWTITRVKEGYIRINVISREKPPDKLLNSYQYENRFRKELEKYKPIERIDLIVNSPGGVVDSAFGMLAALYDRKKCKGRVLIDGWCGSAATLVAFGCKAPVFITPTAKVKTHLPKAMVMANKGGVWNSYQKLAKLSTVNMITAVYRGKCKKKRSEIRKWMEEEKCFSSAEAIEAGLCDYLMTRSEFEQGGQ